MGGDYITWFTEEGRTERSLLYKLENMNIIRCDSEREGKGRIMYTWKLTKKGQKIVDENNLKKIWDTDGKIKVLEFYNKIMEIIGEGKS